MPPLVVFVLLDYRFLFLIVFIVAGSTDFFDGYFARLLDQKTEFGKAYDSAVDLVFYLGSAWFLYRLYPEYLLPNMRFLFAFFGLLLLSFLISFVLCGKPIMMHTFLLKLNGVLVFLLLIFSYFFDTTGFVTFILLVYLVGFVEEILIFIRYGAVDPDTLSIFVLMKEKKHKQA